MILKNKKPSSVDGQSSQPNQLSPSIRAQAERLLLASQGNIVAFDPRGACTLITAEARQFLGLGKDRPAADELELFSHCSVPGDPNRDFLRRALSGETMEVQALEYHLGALANWEGATSIVSCSATLMPVLDENGQVSALYICNSGCRDARETDRPQQCSHCDARLAHSIETAKIFVRRLTHDLNNLNVVVRGYAAVLLMTPELDKESKHLAQCIETAGAETSKLTDNMSSFADQSRLEISGLDLNELISTVLSEDCGAPPAGVQIDLDLEAGLPNVAGDSTRLVHIYRALWDNSVDAMPSGGRMEWKTQLVGAHHGFDGEDKGRGPTPYLRLRVTDSGEGMDTETRQQMFTPFFSTKSGKGRGLGCTIAYDVITRHGGFIEVVSGPGSGTSIDVYHPLA